MAIQEIELPFGEKSRICLICGRCDLGIWACENADDTSLEEPKFKLWDEVRICFLRDGKMRAETYSITRIFYADSDRDYRYGCTRLPAVHHQLCFDLGQGYDVETGKFVPQKPEHKSLSFFWMSQKETLIRSSGAIGDICGLDEPKVEVKPKKEAHLTWASVKSAWNRFINS